MTSEVPVSVALLRCYDALRRRSTPSREALAALESAVFAPAPRAGPSWRLGWGLALATAASAVALMIVPGALRDPADPGPSTIRGRDPVAARDDAGTRSPSTPVTSPGSDPKPAPVELLAARGVSAASVAAATDRIAAAARGCELQGEVELRVDRLGRFVDLDADGATDAQRRCVTGRLTGLRLEPEGAARAGTSGEGRVRLRIR